MTENLDFVLNGFACGPYYRPPVKAVSESLSNRIISFGKLVTYKGPLRFARKHYIALPVVTVVSAAIIWKFRFLIKEKFYEVFEVVRRWIITTVVSKRVTLPNHPPHILRTNFRSVPTPTIKPTNTQHTHPASAAWRSSGMNLAQHLCAKLGMKPYSFQASGSDVKDGIDGCRSYYWDKDSMVPAHNDPITPNHLICIIDVDYYMQMAHFLIQHDNPVLLYSFQPKSASHCDGEFSFTFNSVNEVTYSVSGGAKYNHPVWNYGVDTFTVSHYLTTKTFIVERRCANDHHEYVLLIPVGKWWGIAALVARCLSHTPLERLDVAQGDFAVLDVQNKDNTVRSVSRLGEFNAANVPIKTFNAVHSVARTSSIKIGNATVMSWINDKSASSILVDFFNSQVSLKKPPLVYPVAEGMRAYQIVKQISDYEHEPKCVMEPFMSPIYPNTFVPDKSKNNEIAAVEGRILMPAKEARSLIGNKPLTKRLLKAMETFVELLLPEPHKLHPCEIEEVYVRQGKPSQRAILDASDSIEPKGEAVSKPLKTFMKGEPYQKISDPRVITTYEGSSKREYSRYIYSLADVVSQHKWYSFGKTPRQIAENVAEICKHSESVSAADANRMDGHVESPLRTLEQMILVRAFAEQHKTEVLELHSTQFHRKAVTPQGVKYDIEFQRGSGSGETACFNTIETKFIDYDARLLRGDSPLEAFNAPGQFAGDDTITADLSTEFIVKAAEEVGQSVENVVFLRGEHGVNYLSRFYTPAVWFGAADSMCDLPRALSKLHVTPRLGQFTPIQKLQQKLSGLARTDAKTPIIRNIISAAKRVGMNLNDVGDKHLSGWWSRYEADVNWPNDVDPADIDLEQIVGDVDLKPFEDYLRNVKNPFELLSLPSIASKENLQPKTKQLAVVEGQVIDPPVVVAVGSAGSIKPVAAPVKGPAEPAPTKPPTVAKPSAAVSPPLTSDQICWNYTDSKCEERSKCKLAHQRVCKEFAVDGTCSRGKKCKFLHLRKPGGELAKPPHLPQVSLPAKPSCVFTPVPPSAAPDFSPSSPVGPPPSGFSFNFAPKTTFASIVQKSVANPFEECKVADPPPAVQQQTPSNPVSIST